MPITRRGSFPRRRPERCRFLWTPADRSIRKQAINPKKLHTVDWALGYPFVPETRIDVGRKLEATVFLHWRRQREDLGYLGGEREVDLVVSTAQPEILINVVLSAIDQTTWEREIGALQWAGERIAGARRVLVVQEQSNRKPPEGIEVLEAWRYLLGVPEHGPAARKKSHRTR